MVVDVSHKKPNPTDAQHELRNIQDVGNQRLEQLRRYHKHTYDAVMWLRKNKSKFKATIHEPIILCVSSVVWSTAVDRPVGGESIRDYIFQNFDSDFSTPYLRWTLLLALCWTVDLLYDLLAVHFLPAPFIALISFMIFYCFIVVIELFCKYLGTLF